MLDNEFQFQNAFSWVAPSSTNPGQPSFVRKDEWLTPVTIDERSVAYRGAMPSKTGKRASDKGFLATSLERLFEVA